MKNKEVKDLKISKILEIIEEHFEILEILKNNISINIEYNDDDDYNCEKFEYIDFNKIKDWPEK